LHALVEFPGYLEVGLSADSGWVEDESGDGASESEESLHGGINVEGSQLGTTVEFRRGKGKRNQGGAEDTEKCFGRKGRGDAPGSK